MINKLLVVIILPILIFAAEWQSLNGPPVGRADDMSMGYDPYIPAWVIYAADQTHKLYKSTNEGEYWDSIRPLDVIHPTCVITRPNDAQVVYIGKNDATPVWWSQNGGQTWEARSGTYPNNITNTSPVCFAMDPNDPSVVYLGCVTGSCAFFKTTNGGTDWYAKEILLTTDPTVNDIAISGTTILAGCVSIPGIWRSTDGGDSWAQTLSDVGISAVAFASSNIAYAAGGDGIYKSMDGGVSWTLLPDSPRLGKTIVAINNDIVYLGILASGGSNYSGVYLTTDGGANWNPVNGTGETKVFCQLINKLIKHPLDNNKIFAGARLAIYKSTDAGASWTEITKGFKITEVRALSVSGNRSYVLNVPKGATGEWSGDLFVSRTTDNGVLWKCVDDAIGNWHNGAAQPPLTIFASAINPLYVLLGFFHQNNILRCGDQGVVARTDDGGLHWTNVYQTSCHENCSNNHVNTVDINPLKSQYTYAGYCYQLQTPTQYGFMWSYNYGIYGSWESKSTGLGPNNDCTVYSIAVNPQVWNMIYAGTASNGVYKSLDNADNWNQTALNDKNVNALAIDFDYPDIIYAGSNEPNGIYKTTNSFATYSQANNGLGNYLYIDDLEIDPSEPTIVYALCKENVAATQSYVYCTVDRGGMWFNVSAGLPTDKLTHDLDIDQNQADPVYAGTDLGVYTYTPDFNKHLVSSSSEATSKNQAKHMVSGMSDIWVTYESGGVIYVVHSSDGGTTFSRKMEVGYGYNPAIASKPELDPPAPCVVWWAKGTRDTIYFSRYISDDDWTQAYPIATTNYDFGPPSFIIGTDEMGRVVYTHTLDQHIDYAEFDIYNPVTVTNPEDVGAGTNPSIGFMIPGLNNPEIHITWQNNSNRIKYRARTIQGTWKPEETVYNNTSQNPSIEVAGANVYFVWKRNTDIMYRFTSYFDNGIHTWSNTTRFYVLDYDLTYPVLTGGNAMSCVAGLQEIYFWYNPGTGWQGPINISNTPTRSCYPHICHRQTIIGTVVDFIWTEKDNMPYDIPLAHFSLGGYGSDQDLAFYVAQGGDTLASPNNLRRAGYLNFGDKPYEHVDYDNQYLEYQFNGLNPAHDYALTAYAYQEGYAHLPLTLKVDNILFGGITLPPETLITFKKLVPNNFYTDSMINIKILGNKAVASVFVLHQYEKEQGEGGGPQDKQTMSINSLKPYIEVAPNPFRNQLEIRYTIQDTRNMMNNAGQVFRLAIYDVTGRLVKSFNPTSKILNLTPTITWDGTDEQGRQVRSGVYFIELKAGDFSKGIKAVLVK